MCLFTWVWVLIDSTDMAPSSTGVAGSCEPLYLEPANLIQTLLVQTCPTPLCHLSNSNYHILQWKRIFWCHNKAGGLFWTSSNAVSFIDTSFTVGFQHFPRSLHVWHSSTFCTCQSFTTLLNYYVSSYL